MARCVPIKDLRDTAAFDELVETSPTPITVTKNGYDRFVCLKSSEYERMKQADSLARLYARIAIAERESAAGLRADAREASQAIWEKHGL